MQEYYNKETFIEYLRDKNVSEDSINIFKKFPEQITYKNSKFNIRIDVFENEVITYEIDYYSNNLIEFLLKCKNFTNIEKCINYTYCELINRNFI